MIEKQFKFDNYSRHLGVKGKYDWYEWKVFMDEDRDVLDKVSRVEYRLYYDFPNPIRTVDDRESRFALSSAGWGTFWIDITVYLKDGREIPAGYLLDFGKTWPAGESIMYDDKKVTLDELHRA